MTTMITPARSLHRRSFLRGLAATIAAAPAAQLLFAERARAQSISSAGARRAIFFYFPDGVPGPSSNGDASAWHPTGSEHSFSIGDVLSPLLPWQDRCVFFRGLSMGGTDAGSHPGGAKKLLTSSDGGNGWSLDHYLAETVGAASPFRHVRLGAQAAGDGASGDKHITYVAPGQTVAPNDNPIAVFDSLFSGASLASPTSDPVAAARARKKRSVIDGALADMAAFRARAGAAESAKLDFHLESLREVEQRLRLAEDATGETVPPSCQSPVVDGAGVSSDALYAAERFPSILKMHIDVLVNAMACGLTKVGTIQASHHTSELIMSRFAGTELHTPNFDMRSHQASHYGPSHDVNHVEYAEFVKQRRWFASQLAYLLEQLALRPEGDGSMLDHTLVLFCTEVCDGNTHSHDDMPFIVAGGGAWSTGRLLSFGYERHSRLLVSIARALGQDIDGFGDVTAGPLPL